MPYAKSRDHAAYVASLGDYVQGALSELVDETYPENLYGPVRYVLAAGGKRLRPALTLLSAEVFGIDAEQAIPAALAVEVFHNFTLVHDDIMDGANERRGRPAVHVKWDQSDAILAGDLMMGISYDLLAQLPVRHLDRVIRAFHRMVVRLCEGQALDKAFESRRDVTLADYMQMIDGKTGALIEICLQLGGFLGDADEPTLERLVRIGGHIGRAFQIQDDLLDLTAIDDSWGKPIGGDLIVGKKTYLLLKCIELADAENASWFERIYTDGGLSESEVPEARNRMDGLGVLEHTRATLADMYAAADADLVLLPNTPAVDTLRWLVARMAARVN